MAVTRDDVQDATGRRTFISGVAPVSGVGGGNMRGFPMNSTDANSSTGVPTNGKPGFLPGATFQNFKGSVGSAFYVNVGTVASATWVELTGGGGLGYITISANTADAFYFTDGTTKLIDLDSRNTVTGVTSVLVKGSPPTITSATGDTYSQFGTGAITVTLTGTTTVTALDGLGAYLGVPTVTDASAVTVTTLSNLYVALPVAGGSVTATNIYSAHFAGAVLIDGNIVVSAQATTITAKANTAATLVVSDGTTSLASFDSRNTIANVNTLTLTGSAPTIASAAAVHQNSTLNIAAKTVTYTGTNTVTSSLGVGLFIGAPTFTDASAGTITTVSNLHVAAVAAAGGSLTITNSRMISTGVSDCYLTNGGVWTDTACWAWGKENIVEPAQDMIASLIDRLTPKAWNYAEDGAHGNDFGRNRVGVVYDDLPGELRAPGDERGVSAGLLASFALAAIKMLKNENDALKGRIAALEARA